MSSKIKLQMYVTPEQRRFMKIRLAKSGCDSMGDYVWSLVEKDMDLDELAELRVSEKVS